MTTKPDLDIAAARERLRAGLDRIDKALGPTGPTASLGSGIKLADLRTAIAALDALEKCRAALERIAATEECCQVVGVVRPFCTERPDTDQWPWCPYCIATAALGADPKQP